MEEKDPLILHNLYYGCWWFGDNSSQEHQQEWYWPDHPEFFSPKRVCNTIGLYGIYRTMLTFQMRKAEYSRITSSIPCLLITWFLAELEHQIICVHTYNTNSRFTPTNEIIMVAHPIFHNRSAMRFRDISLASFFKIMSPGKQGDMESLESR